jgi:hypothetical protein
MQQRFAFALLIRLTKSSTPTGPLVEMLHGSVQAAEAPEASHFTSLRHFNKWIENVLPPHDSPEVMPIQATSTAHRNSRA